MAAISVSWKISIHQSIFQRGKIEAGLFWFAWTRSRMLCSVLQENNVFFGEKPVREAVRRWKSGQVVGLHGYYWSNGRRMTVLIELSSPEGKYHINVFDIGRCLCILDRQIELS